MKIGFKSLLESRKACFASIIITLASVMVFLDVMDGGTWVDFVKTITVTYVGAEAVDSGMGKMGVVFAGRKAQAAPVMEPKEDREGDR